MKLTDEAINLIIGDIDTDAPAIPHQSEVRVMFADKVREIRERSETREEFLLGIAEEFKGMRPMLEPGYRKNADSPASAFMLEAFDLYDEHHRED